MIIFPRHCEKQMNMVSTLDGIEIRIVNQSRAIHNTIKIPYQNGEEITPEMEKAIYNAVHLLLIT